MTETVFETPRLTGRRLSGEDTDALLAVYGDAETMRWVGDGQPLSREQCSQWIEVTAKNYETRGYGMFVLELRQTGALIGFCGLVHPGGQPEPEVKYALLHDFWGQGYATEATRALLAYGFQAFGLARIIATVYAENVASRRVLAKAGMQTVGSRREGNVIVYACQPLAEEMNQEGEAKHGR